jgi:hypothetical protein
LIQTRAVNSRPDLQPAVVDALRKTYPIVELLCRQDNGQERAIEDLLRYDGGDGAASGQLASDLILRPPSDAEEATVRLTAEMDLLMATGSVEELDLGTGRAASPTGRRATWPTRFNSSSMRGSSSATTARSGGSTSGCT